MSMLKEFREFALKGNVVDLAVGVIIGAAFGTIVSSLVDDMIMPLVGAVTGGLDFSNYFIPLSSAVTATTLDAAREQGAVFAYGKFLTAVLKFAIVVARFNDFVTSRLLTGAQEALAHHHGTFQLTDEAIDAPVTALDEALKQANIPPERFAALKPGQVYEV